MKKNGFTLVELLAVIIILSIVAVVAVPRLVTSIKINNEDSYNGVIENIILAANSYANNQGGVLVQISVPYLQEKGYLPRNITSPIDNSIMSGCVYVVDGTSIYSEETCSTYLKGIEPSRMVTNACTYQNGYTWDFEYTGIGQEFIVPCDGTYKLEVWGASGGDADTTYVGGKGGYSIGNKSLTANDKIYINVGGVGGVCSGADATCNGGYNGGGSGKSYREVQSNAAGGGGATHIGTFNDLLANHGSTDGLFIVAAGGGGGHYTNSVNCGKGGAGGGTTGADPTGLCRDNLANDPRTAQGGTENAAGCAKDGGYCGAFGSGANLTVGGSGGGGGLYGGSGASIGPGGGGSSYIGGVSNGSTIAGNASMPTHDGASTMTGNTGNGYAKITLISY